MNRIKKEKFIFYRLSSALKDGKKKKSADSCKNVNVRDQGS